MKRRKTRGAVELPKGVHRVPARGREFFYYQAGRGTKHAGPRVRLPNDPHSPEFWQALRQAQGIVGPVPTDTINALIDAYEAAWPKLPKKLSEGTQDQYRRALKRARKMWGALHAKGLRPTHVRAAMEDIADSPGAANNFLSAMRALSSWARARDHIDFPLTDGIRPYEKSGGHRPWTDEQIKVAHEHLIGMVRRGVMLLLYTGQRGSDMVRLGPTMIDDGGFDLGWKGQVKTNVRPWCPIMPELSKEMESWEKRPGPFVLNERGKPYTRKHFSVHFAAAKKQLAEQGITALNGTTLHGLRGTACVRLKRAGLSVAMIADIVGMSMVMVDRYTRFENKRESGKAALMLLAEHAAKKDAAAIDQKNKAATTKGAKL